MTAQAWKLYNLAKEKLADGTFDLDTDTFQMALFQGDSNAATATLGTYASLNNELASANGYIQGGKTITAVTWSVGSSAAAYRFDSTAVVWTASGDITSIQLAVVHDGTDLLMYCTLNSAIFTLTSGNTLTVTPSATGYFEMV